MYFQVTEEHIKAGVPKSPSNCPIALAFKDNYKNVEFEVYKDRIVTRVGAIQNETPIFDEALKACIQKYDETGEMKPFNIGADTPRPNYILQGPPVR